MSEADKRETGRVPVVLRIKLQHPDVDTFIEKFATNISRGGMFIASRTPKPVGTGIRFELRLANDSPVIAGQGVVRWVREFDPKFPRRAHGMGIQFSRLDPTSRALLERIVDHRRRMGLAEELPAGDGGPGAATTAPRTEAAPAQDATIVAPARPRPPTTPPAPPAAAVARAETIPDAVPQAIAADATTAPSARWSEIPPLAARPARRPAVDLASAIARVSGPAEPDTGDPELVGGDLSSALRRAHELAHSARRTPDREDPELAELLRVAAAPVAETVDDASAKLAMLLGGSAVRTRRNTIPGTSPPAPRPRPAPPPPAPPPAAPAPPSVGEDTLDGAPAIAADDAESGTVTRDEDNGAPLGPPPIASEAPTAAGVDDALPIDLDADALDADELVASGLHRLSRRRPHGEESTFADSTEVPALPPIPRHEERGDRPRGGVRYDPAQVLASAPDDDSELDEVPTGILHPTPVPTGPMILRHPPGAPAATDRAAADDDIVIDDDTSAETDTSAGGPPDGEGAPKKKGFFNRIFGK